jgi:hypothetical protein
MPLHDHFRGPLASRRHWTAFHGAWATYISEDLNERLLPGYFAEATVRFGIEIDVATWQENGSSSPSAGNAREGWQPEAPHMTIPFVLATDEVEVLIFRQEGGPVLAGAVELVSPANKDRPASRDAFVSKCAAYLHQGVGLAMIDLVTSAQANLHELLLARTSPDAPQGRESELYAAAYHPVETAGQTSLEMWYEALALGGPLPTLPLWLRGGICMPLFLETTYQKTIVKQRILANGS